MKLQRNLTWDTVYDALQEALDKLQDENDQLNLGIAHATAHFLFQYGKGNHVFKTGREAKALESMLSLIKNRCPSIAKLFK